jgi:hypothetical protein
MAAAHASGEHAPFPRPLPLSPPTCTAFQFLLVSEVPKKGYQTLLDWVMSIGLFVQLITCLLVFLNADNPHDPDWDRSAFYQLTDRVVVQVEWGFLVAFIAPWILGNIVLVVLARFKLWSMAFSHLTRNGQGWINSVLGMDEHGLVDGQYTLVRCNLELDRETVKMTKSHPNTFGWTRGLWRRNPSDDDIPNSDERK